MSDYEQFFGRLTSEFKLNTLALASTSYQTLYSFTGAGIISGITMAAAVTDLTKPTFEITVDGGTLYEITMSTHIILGANEKTWTSGATSNEVIVLPVISSFNTSILIRVKSTDTNAIKISIASSEDQ